MLQVSLLSQRRETGFAAKHPVAEGDAGQKSWLFMLLSTSLKQEHIQR